jgi:hypothetical protein
MINVGCAGKMPYNNYRDAEKVLKTQKQRIRKKSNKSRGENALVVYPCRHCAKFHIGKGQK